MNCKTFEMYDENEYFLKYLAIHPFLTYSIEPLNIKKLEYQKELLNQFNLENITYDELKKNYVKILNIEKMYTNKLETIKLLNKKIEDEIYQNNNKQLIELYSNLLNNKN